MIASLNQISTPMLLGGGFAILVLNTLFLKWFLGKIQSEPAEEPEVDEAPGTAESLASEPAFRTSAGVPRSKPIQPVTLPPAGADVGNPIRLTSLTEKTAEEKLAAEKSISALTFKESLSPATAEVLTLPAKSASSPVEPAPAPTPISLTKMPAGSAAPTASLTALPQDKPAADAPPAAKVTPSLSPLFSAPESAPTGEIPPILPPLNFTKRAGAPERPSMAPILEQGRPASADLIMTPNIPPSGGSGSQTATAVEGSSGKPPISLTSTPSAAPAADLIFVDKPSKPLSSVTPDPKETSAVKTEGSEGAAKEMSPLKSSDTPKSTGADLIAIPPGGTSDKGAGTEPVSPTAGSGLILIPSSPEASPVTPEEDKPAAASTPAPTSWKTRLLGRPRIFLPTGGTPTATDPAAETIAETPIKAERDDAKPAEPAKSEVTEPKSEAPVKSEPAESEAKPIIAPDSSSENAKKPEAKVEADIPAQTPATESMLEFQSPAPEKSESKTPEMLVPSGNAATGSKLGKIAESEILVPSDSKSPAKVDEKAPEPASSIDLAPKVDVSAKPVDKASEPEPKKETPPASVEVPSTVVAPPTADIAPIVPAAAPAAPVTASTPPAKAAEAPKPSAPLTSSVMNQKESTATTMPSGGRASAQITLGFEITSLQLTPFFKLGAVQLRSLSNIVSLHLIASQAAENPLAAGISFQIETVDLDESSHIKSILLKPLGQSTSIATPQPKLQVENVKIGTGNEGAIEVTSSQQTSTAVQMLATFTIAAMDFTPSFEIGSLRLEPNSNSVMLRLAPSSKPTALDLPPSFEVATVTLEGSAQLATVRLVPGGSK